MAFTREKSWFSIMSYFNAGSLKALLNKEIGCSWHSLFFCRRTTTMVWSEENEKNRKSLVKSRLINIGARFKAYFTLLNDCPASMLHFTSASFFSLLVMFFKISAKFKMNLLRKIIFLIKD